MSTTMMASNQHLAILSAEKYDDGSCMGQRRPKRQHSETTPYGQASADQEDGEKGRRRKKARLSPGRPRVDTKDVTNADRRRTQIRMAQRAYRERKETTIFSLTAQVQDLRSTNEEMSSIFRHLYDFAQKRGVMEREAEFAQHLQSTKLQFMSLAKSAASETTKEGGSDGELQREGTLNTADYSQLESGSMQPAVALSNNKPFVTQFRGYQKLGIVSRPDPEKTCSRFSIATDLQFRQEIPDPHILLQWPVNNVLPMPRSYAYQEPTFARRLVRECSEAAYYLIASEPPQTERLLKVFGFVLNFESLDTIKARLSRCLSAGTKDALYDWRQPFVHLGRAGTHYPDFNENGISGDLQPKLQTGMSMGPHSAKVYETRDNLMEDQFGMKVDGYEGDFFDASDVESYLRARGVEFPSGADTIYIDLDQLGAFDFGDSFEESTVCSIWIETPRCSEEPKQPLFMGFGFQDGKLDLDVVNKTDAGYTDRYGPYSMTFTDWGDDLHLATADQIRPGPPAFHMKYVAGTGFSDAPNIPHTVNQDAMKSPKKKTKRIAAITVTNLIIEMTRSVICLGRSSGIKPKDVDAALHRVLIDQQQGLPGL